MGRPLTLSIALGILLACDPDAPDAPPTPSPGEGAGSGSPGWIATFPEYEGSRISALEPRERGGVLAVLGKDVVALSKNGTLDWAFRPPDGGAVRHASPLANGGALLLGQRPGWGNTWDLTLWRVGFDGALEDTRSLEDPRVVGSNELGVWVGPDPDGGWLALSLRTTPEETGETGLLRRLGEELEVRASSEIAIDPFVGTNLRTDSLSILGASQGLGGNLCILIGWWGLEPGELGGEEQAAVGPLLVTPEGLPLWQGGGVGGHGFDSSTISSTPEGGCIVTARTYNGSMGGPSHWVHLASVGEDGEHGQGWWEKGPTSYEAQAQTVRPVVTKDIGAALPSPSGFVVLLDQAPYSPNGEQISPPLTCLGRVEEEGLVSCPPLFPGLPLSKGRLLAESPQGAYFIGGNAATPSLTLPWVARTSPAPGVPLIRMITVP